LFPEKLPLSEFSEMSPSVEVPIGLIFTKKKIRKEENKDGIQTLKEEKRKTQIRNFNLKMK
jgi:hypothetical protein